MSMQKTRVEDGVNATSSFELFYRNERDHIVRVLAVVLRDRELAAEAVDEGMVRAYQRWRSVERYDNPTGWVYRVALNWATSRLRRRKRETGAEPPERSSHDAVVDVDLERALAGLEVEARTMVVLKHLEGMRYEEIGQVLSLPAGTVKSRLHRVMNGLREVLEVQE
jgi:RNA polymerase sigma factor (sigma-70 family)